MGLLEDASKIYLKGNMLCGDIPDEVAALEHGKNLRITTDNSIGTPCSILVPSQAPTISSPTVLPSSCRALNALYESTAGASWDDKENWSNGCPCTNDWYGVDCKDGEVVKLKLNGNNLDGSIPTQ